MQSEGARKVRIMIVDDHPIVCQGIRRLVEQEGDLTVCAEAQDTEGALWALESNRPDLVLLDLKLKDTEGLDFLKMLHARAPELAILVLSMFDRRIYEAPALEAGARGYVMKQEAAASLIEAIRRIFPGAAEPAAHPV